ncbi:MAG TPA: hypothetical protein VLE48_04375 [Terriglobales bacterium]|nr:hypothetical protein [Terriglobales bacterium]
MAGINTKRVLLGGLVAGLISNVSGLLLAHFFLAGDVRALLERLNVQLGLGTALLHLGMRFGVGISLVWLYTAIRPRFGPGPRTAALAGLALWFFTYAFSLLGIAPYGLYPASTLVMGAVWGLGELQLAALAGAYLYRE